MTDDARLPVDEGWVLERLEDLIKIPSVNPSLVPGGEGEERIARFVGQVLGDLGLKVTYQKLGPKRANVIGVLKGKGGAAGPAGRAGSGRTLLLNGHLDTVGAAGMKIEPFAPARRGNKVYGRGAFDMKGGVAAMLGVARAIVASGVALAGDLILTFVADEEYASIGTEKIAQTYRADAAIVCEPTGLNIGVVHKGFAWVRLDVQGKAAHGSEFGQGVDAITKAGKFLAAMEAYEKRVLAKKVHPKVGRPSVHASLISGGIELSTYPDHCRVEIERRTIPGETRQTVVDEIEKLIRRVAAKDKDFKAEAEVFFYRSPMEASPDEPIVKCLQEARRAVVGRRARLVGSFGWLDSAILSEAGIPTVIFGAGGEGAHAKTEWADLRSCVATARVLAVAAVDFCGTA